MSMPQLPVEGVVVLRDPAAIKALTHPARLAVLEELFRGRELTATECAEIAGVSPSAMSYHLRALAKAGIVVAGEPSADGRRRPWRAAGSSLQVSVETATTGAADAGRALIDTVLDQVRTEAEAWVARSETGEWREASGFSAMTLELTLEQTRTLSAALETAAEQARQNASEGKPPGRSMRLAMMLFPTDQTPPGPP